jgi:hypothetical protein
MTPIASVDVTRLDPPAGLLREIDAMARAIEVLLPGGAIDAAKTVAAQLQSRVASARATDG